jgi:ABC-type phosphate/phosphonate transport system permease subunit
MFDKIARKMLSPINTAAVSILGFFNLFMGIWISLPFDALSTPNTFPEWIISAGMLIVGMFSSVSTIGSCRWEVYCL